jgi:hypothetical protein
MGGKYQTIGKVLKSKKISSKEATSIGLAHIYTNNYLSG